MYERERERRLLREQKINTSITSLIQRAVSFDCLEYWRMVADTTLDTASSRSLRTLNPFPFPQGLALAPALTAAVTLAVATVDISSSSSSPGTKSMRARRLAKRSLKSELPLFRKRFRFPRLAK